MNRDLFILRLDENKMICDRAFASYFKGDFKLIEPMVYATDSGKRIRATLYFETLRMLDKDISEDDILFALAIEMIHAYSLVHDDLPAMDNDQMRRGKPTVHAKYGEDIGILTGDALLNEAARLLFALSLRNSKYLKASEYLFRAAGHEGMIDGQVLDLNQPKVVDLSYVFDVYSKKTAALFRAAVVGAAFVAGAGEDALKALEDFAENLGLAFQIQDDLLEESYGDELNILNVTNRPTAMNLLDKCNDEARKNISAMADNDFLLYIIDYLTNRKQ